MFKVLSVEEGKIAVDNQKAVKANRFLVMPPSRNNKDATVSMDKFCMPFDFHLEFAKKREHHLDVIMGVGRVIGPVAPERK